MELNLHNIFRSLVNDPNFLSIIIDEDDEKIEKKKKKKQNYNIMTNIIPEYTLLIQPETQIYELFPVNVKLFLTPDYVRMGVKNIRQKNMNIINVSFLNSLNILLRPDIYQCQTDENNKNLVLLENFICHMIQRNTVHIDKVKNTKKMQAINAKMISNLKEGKITHEIIQYIVNIFEINLLVFDFTKSETYLYWSRGHIYPFFNTFRDIYCMAYVHGNHEPIMAPNNKINDIQKNHIYSKILSNSPELKCLNVIKLGFQTLLHIRDWDLNHEDFMNILKNHYSKKMDLSKHLDQFENLEKKLKASSLL